MSDSGNGLPLTNEPIRVAVRRLHWFRRAFADHVRMAGDEIGCAFDLDQAALTGAFVRWLRAIEIQNPKSEQERKEFFVFAAGLMLRELNRTMPVSARAAPQLAAPDSAAAFWPEGYVCTMFCVKLLTAAIEQEFHQNPEIADAFNDLRHWWSYRENVARDSSFAAGFLQLLMGQEPNWMMPDVFRLRLQRDLRAN